MGTQSKYTNEERDRAVKMYQDGAKLRDITAETGIPRPTIMYFVQAAGLEPNRQGTRRSRPRNGDESTQMIDWMMKRMEELARENERLRNQTTTTD
jgi:transposase-like protein